MARNVKYIFRGTTVGFPGSANSQKIPVTCATSNPAIALFFAMVCANDYPDDAVVYVAKMENFAIHKMPANVLKKMEREVAFNISPVDFYELTERYVTFKALRQVLVSMGFSVPQLVGLENLTEHCSKTRDLTDEEMNSLISQLEELEKK